MVTFLILLFCLLVLPSGALCLDARLALMMLCPRGLATAVSWMSHSKVQRERSRGRERERECVSAASMQKHLFYPHTHTAVT